MRNQPTVANSKSFSHSCGSVLDVLATPGYFAPRKATDVLTNLGLPDTAGGSEQIRALGPWVTGVNHVHKKKWFSWVLLRRFLHMPQATNRWRFNPDEMSLPWHTLTTLGSGCASYASVACIVLLVPQTWFLFKKIFKVGLPQSFHPTTGKRRIEWEQKCSYWKATPHKLQEIRFFPEISPTKTIPQAISE